MSTLNGKIALVTGGSRGIGAAIVRRLCADGATVFFTYASSEPQARQLEAEIEAAGQRAIAIQADSADPAAVQRAVDTVVQAQGRIDILVNNAGISMRGAIEESPIADFDRIVAVNVRGVFATIHSSVPHMQSGARIVNIGSVVADRTGVPELSLYSMSKAAVAGLTRAMARDLGPRGITINNVQPGPTETEMIADESVRAMLRTMIPVGRMGHDSEIADFVAYLVQPGAAFINGAALTIDGGYLA